MSSSVIKDTNFELVTEFARTDAKKRLSLGEALAGSSAFNIYRNTFGQLFLDPVRAVPADEAWLFENPAALASVKRGLEQAARGEVHDLGDFSKHAKGNRDVSRLAVFYRGQEPACRTRAFSFDQGDK